MVANVELFTNALIEELDPDRLDTVTLRELAEVFAHASANVTRTKESDLGLHEENQRRLYARRAQAYDNLSVHFSWAAEERE